MEFLRADYTEVWVPSAVVPLVQFADRVASLATTGIDTFGIDGLPEQSRVLDRLLAFDEVVSWYGSNRAEFRRAVEQGGVNCVFHAALPAADGGTHASDFLASQVGAPLGGFARLKLERQNPRGSVVLHPFSGSVGKNWPLARYRELAAELQMPIEWLAGPEEELVDAVRIADLGELAQWLTGARVYVGNDSGITHLAAASGLFTVAVFGPTDPRVWCARGPNVRSVRHEPLSELSVETVRELMGV